MSSEESLENDATSAEQDPQAGDPDAFAASEDGQLADEGEGAGKKTLGIERWVQLCFVVAALTLIWLFDHLISGVWYIFADPEEALVSAGAVVAGIIGAILLYKQRATYSLVHDVVEELAKVTWPTRKETSQSTVVVVVTSIVAALMLFLFDSVWSAVTDLVYKV